MTRLKVPGSLTEEHHELFHELRELASEKGGAGKAVKELLKVLEPHFEREEQAAMPLLGILGPLSEGKAVRHASEVVSLYAKFLSEYPEMLKEHARVKELVEGVRAASAGSRRRRVMSVMNELELHAKVEEEVLYPAALLAGVFVKGGMKVEAP